ncbi:hypothetical protein LEMLEM_LOCUS19020 [Lemmus lemmus]
MLFTVVCLKLGQN